MPAYPTDIILTSPRSGRLEGWQPALTFHVPCADVELTRCLRGGDCRCELFSCHAQQERHPRLAPADPRRLPRALPHIGRGTIRARSTGLPAHATPAPEPG